MDTTKAKTENVKIDCAAYADIEGKIINCKQSFSTILGYNYQELVGASLSKIFKRNGFLQDALQIGRLQNFSNMGGLYAFEEEVLSKDGSVVICFLEIEILKDSFSHKRYIVLHLNEVK